MKGVMMSKKKVSAKQNPPQATQSWGEWFNSLFKKKKKDTDAGAENAKPIASGPPRSSRMNSTGKWAAIIVAAALFIGLGIATGGIGPLVFTVAVGAVMIGARAAHINSVRKGEQRANDKAASSASTENTKPTNEVTSGKTATQAKTNTVSPQSTVASTPASKSGADALKSLPKSTAETQSKLPDSDPDSNKRLIP